jgi:F0F1-type ATP synthase assembly protein I
MMAKSRTLLLATDWLELQSQQFTEVATENKLLEPPVPPAGNVATGILAGLVPGIILGAYLGGYIAHFIPDTPLCLAFIAAIIFMGFRYVRSSAPKDTSVA